MGTHRDIPRVVVGVDNTPAGTSALRWAAEQACVRHAVLDVIHVHDPRERAWAALEGNPTEELREVRRRLFVRVADRLDADISRGAGVAVSVQGGPLIATLANAARGAELLVLGEPTAPDHEDLPEKLSARCECAVAIVGEDGRARIVSGESSVHTRRPGATARSHESLDQVRSRVESSGPGSDKPGSETYAS